MRGARAGLRCIVVALVAALAMAACSGAATTPGPAQASVSTPTRGGTLTFLTSRTQIAHLDPQRNYAREDQAFSSAYLTRTLTAYKVSKDGLEASTLVPDLATDTGRSTVGGKSWTFTLRAGSKFEDGSPITCSDVKYGVSRTFAQSVITEGPQYALNLLDIPKAADGSSTYKGPYVTSGNDTAAYDKAVECSPDNKTITFHLAKPAGDFNFIVSLPAFSPVPKAKDTDAKYDNHPVSSGPYKIAEYSKGQELVLAPNPNWSATQDTYRHRFPDKIVVKFSVPSAVIDERMIADAGSDQTAVSVDSLTSASLTTVFNNPRFSDRRVNSLVPSVRYIAINAKKVPNLKQRRAILAAADRAGMLKAAGGSYTGELADGVVTPTLSQDYAPSGLWTTLLGAFVPDGGNPALARRLIAESGASMPTLTYDYAKSSNSDQVAAVLQSSLARAGIALKLNPIDVDRYYETVLDPARQHELTGATTLAPDWPNASTIIPQLFAPTVGLNLSRVDDRAFTARSDQAVVMTDRAAQSKIWKELNATAMANAWVLPTWFPRSQRLVGSKVGSVSGGGRVYLWAPYGSWSYSDLYVKR